MKRTTAEQITDFQSKRAASAARMDAIMEKSSDEGRTLEVAETEEYETLQGEVKAIDEHLVRLKAHEASNVAAAKVVTPENTNGAVRSAETRSGIVSVKSNAPQGIGMARMAIAMCRAKDSMESPISFAQRTWPDSPEVALTLRAAVEAGDTTTSGWASQLVPAAQQLNNEFLGLLRPNTIIGRIPGLRKVPFNIAVPVETASGTAAWVGEAAAKPVTSLTLTSVTLRWAKAAAIVAITKELARFSSPDAELVVRNSMVKTLTAFYDAAFVGSAAEVTNIAPAGILNGISSTAVTGTTAAFFRTDMGTILNKMTGHKVPLNQIVLLMSSTMACNLSLMVTSLGVPLFPNVTRDGGSVLGFPVIVSEAVGTNIIALNADDVLLAEDPGVQVDVSDTASVEMSTAPISGDTSPFTGTTLKSFWQNNLIGVRVEQFITWKLARTASCEYLTSVAYLP